MATPEEAYKHITPLDFESAKSIPDSHVWPQESEEVVHSGDGLTVPVIDLPDPNALQLMTEACQTWGMFQLKGHGIPTKVMEDMQSECERLFSLPTEQKMKALRTPGGITGYGLPRIQPFYSTSMWHEGFTIMGSAVDHARLLWPDDYQGFCDKADDYQKQMKALAEQVMRILFKAMNVHAEKVDWFNDPTNISSCKMPLQLNSNPPCPNPTRTMNLAPHTDTSIITILKATSSGLQVYKDGVGWVAVEPLPDALIVNLGDFAHIMSDGRFISVLHRVAAVSFQRYSMGYFFRPPMDFTLSPFLSKDLGLGQVPRYRSITAREYVELKAKHLRKTFSLIEN